MRPWKQSLTLLLSLIAGCESGRQTPLTDSDWRTAPSPPVVGPAKFNFWLRTPTGGAVNCREVRVEANMTHPGMQPVFATAKRNDAGEFEASFRFTMAGDWYLALECREPGGRIFQRIVNPVTVHPQ